MLLTKLGILSLGTFNRVVLYTIIYSANTSQQMIKGACQGHMSLLHIRHALVIIPTAELLLFVFINLLLGSCKICKKICCHL